MPEDPQPLRLLLVEDNPGMSQMLVAYLGRKDFQVLPVADGERALQMLERQDFDLVLSDIRMPGATGHQVLAAARARPAPPTVILMTAYANVDSVIEALEGGAYAYVRKPFMDLDHDIGLVLDRAVRERRLEAHNRELVGKLKHASAVILERQKQIKHDLQIAGHIQRSLLPDELVRYPRLTVATRRFIGENLSGDFYDTLPLADGAVGVILGQVMGRDLPAAILMAAISAHLRELARRYSNPLEVLGAANAAISGVLERGYENFVSVFYGVVAADRSKIEYICAGHPPPVRVRFSRPPEVLPSAGDPFLGKYPKARFGMASSPLVKEDRLLLFSEGAPGLQNDQGTALSAERLGRWADEAGIGRTAVAAETLAERLERWSGGKSRERNVVLMLADLV